MDVRAECGRGVPWRGGAARIAPGVAAEVAMGTFLIIGQSGDTCCRGVRERLEEGGHRVVFVPEDRALPGLDLAWEVQGRTLRGRAGYGGQAVAFGEIDGVLARFYGIPVSPEVFATADGRYVSAEWNALMMAWLASLPCPVVNRLRPELWYRASLNVPGLAALVPGSPFRRPATMVTTRVDDAREFRRRCGGRVRYVPLTQPVDYRIGDEESFEKLAALSGSVPFQLVEAVEGERVEAFVIGERVVLTAADGSVLHGPRGRVADDAREVARALGLAFCRLALVGPADGAWSCLSVERTPQIFDCDEEARRLVIASLADLLTADGEGVRP